MSGFSEHGDEDGAFPASGRPEPPHNRFITKVLVGLNQNCRCYTEQ
jgi:hypothetical protein